MTKTRTAAVKLTDEQYRMIEQKAGRCGMRVAAWARSILIQAAKRPAKDGRLILKEPDGTLS